MSKIKILFYIAALGKGGAERVLVNLLNNLDQEKYDIDLCLLFNKNVYKNEIPREVNCFSLISNKLLWYLARSTQKLIKSNFIFKYLFLRKIGRNYNVATCFFDGEYTFLLSYLPSTTRKITWIHSSYITNPAYQKIVRSVGLKNMVNIYNIIDDFIFVSNDAMASFINVFGKYRNMKVIYNFIMNDQLQTYANITPTKSNKFLTGVAVGRLDPVKGFDRLIRVIAMLKNSGYNLKVQILGDGPERKTLQKLIMMLNVESEVHLLGFQPNPYEYMSNADFYILSSISEGLPTVICESFLLGLPIISTRCTGATELLNEGEFGLMAEQTDDSLYEAIKTFIEDRNKLQYYATQSKARAAICDEKQILNDINNLMTKNNSYSHN